MAKAKKEKKEKKIEPYWQEMVGVYFDFTKSKFHDIPSFDGSAPRDLKNILQALRKRAEDKGIEWTQEVAIIRFRHFLEHCWMDRWLSDNWLLMNIARQKDKIFFSITRQYLSR
jgi:hypothetical protein